MGHRSNRDDLLCNRLLQAVKASTFVLLTCMAKLFKTF